MAKVGYQKITEHKTMLEKCWNFSIGGGVMLDNQ